MGLEKAVFCKICGQKYFPVSLPFHQKVCIKIFQLTHKDCPICKRAIFNSDWRDHVDLCKKMPKRQHQSGLSVVHTMQSIQKGINQAMGDAQGRYACMICNRKFTLDRIDTHENVCRRRFQNKTVTLADSDPSHSVDPKLKPKMMTLNDFNRPKSKQVNKMPSLRNKPLPEKKVKPINTFGGKGVRLGSMAEDTSQEEAKAKASKTTTFSGITKVNKNQPKIEFKWRCQKCMTINKVDEHKNCQKCSSSRDLTKEEQKQKEQDDQELETMISDFGNIEELEDQREDILDFISELEIEATQIFICYSLEKLIMIIGNIINKPTEDKYKILKMDNNVFYSNIGRFSTGIKLIKYLGFESLRLDTQKLAYKYQVPTVPQVHPLLLLAYDELRTALARNQSDKLTFTEGNEESKEQPADEQNLDQERVECVYCLRKFARDRVDTHQFICYKIKNQKPKRKVWDGAKRRLKGTVFEGYKPQYKNYFHDQFEIFLSRRDQANMEKILMGLKLTREEYLKRAQDLKMDNNWYFRCRQCREVMHESLCKKHKCQIYDSDEEETKEEAKDTVQINTEL